MTNTEITTDPRVHLERAIATGDDVIASVRPEHLALPTPCGEFDVRRLLGHLVEVLQRVEALGRGDNPFGFTPPTDAGDDPLASWRAATVPAKQAWGDEAAMVRTITLPWKTGTGREVLGDYVEEITVHTWDLATAIGVTPAWNDEVVAFADAAIRESLPVPVRAALFAQVKADLPPAMRYTPPPFADAVAVPHDAPAIDRLVAWTGRRP